MQSAFLSLLCCPTDHGPLTFRPDGPSPLPVPQGALVCSICGSSYPVQHGIPRFLTAERNELCPLQQAEMAARDRAYRRGAGRLRVADVPEFDAVRAALGDSRGRTIVDVGCGVGKFNPLLNNPAYLLGVDLSWEGLTRFQKPDCPVGLLQADATRLPVGERLFDIALCCQVLSHLPTHDHRARLLSELARVLKPHGSLILTAMHYSFRYRQKSIPQEAEEYGTFYHRVEVTELRDLLSREFNIRLLQGYWIYLPKTYWLFMALGPLRGYWDRLWRNRPLSLVYGKYLLAVCSPKL